MMRKILWAVFVLAGWAVPSFAETFQQDRIHGAIANNPSVVLQGNVHPYAQPVYDQGPVEPGMKLGYVTMVLQSTASQQADLKQFLVDLQNPSSPSYHKWLTPEQYAARFGVSPHDITTIANWLTAQGFEVVQTARGRNWIAFSGTAEQVESVFQTQIHYYLVDGEKHFANATSPSIPKGLSGMVMGFRGMDDFRPKPMNVKQRGQLGTANPDYSSGGFNNLAPDDIATIYDIATLFNSGINGTGQKLVIVGQTDISLTDIQNFRSGFNLPASNPTVMLFGPDPGTSPNDLPEADLDLEWSGAVARDATIIYANSNNVFTSAQNAIDNNLAPVISMSYGACESLNAPLNTLEALFQQANSQGITFLASSGDSGAAACDADSESSATQGLAVNYPASSPEVTGVGGTEFNEGGGTYWGTNGSNLGSALSYIPEMAWNDSDVTGIQIQGTHLASSGGGKSSCGTGSGSTCAAFPKPSWQSATGVPNDSVRDVPDISMAASADHDGYIFCTSGSCAGGVVQNISIVGGTSAATPVFAGLITLMNDYIVSHSGTAGLGNINTKLYQLYATAPTAFHDVTTGNNIVPCTQGTTGCPTTAPFQYGYSAGTGYDQVTGLGSVDANEFILAFTGTTAATTTTALALNPAPVNGVFPGSNTNVTTTLTATVTPSTATGTVTFMDNGSAIGTPQTLSSGVATLASWVLSAGSHSLSAVYNGGSNFQGSTSPSISALVTLNSPNTTAANSTPNAAPYGTPVTVTATVTATSGTATPTGTVAFTINSTVLGSGTLSGTGTSATAQFTSSAIPTGSNTITASYSGDANYSVSQGATSATISKASTTTNVSAPASVNAGTLVTITATINQSGSGAAPTGTATFLNGSTTLGTGTVSGGTATFSSNSLAAGAYNITVQYGGDANYTGSTSSATTLNVQSFTLQSGVTINVSAPGQSGSGTLMETAVAGFNGTITYSCNISNLAGAACTTAPTSNGVTVTVTTTAPSSDLIMPGKSKGMFYAMLLPGIVGLAFAGFRKRSFKGMQVICLMTILGLSTLWMGACGGSSSSGGGGGGGTPTGTASMTVTGTSGSITVNQTVTVNVQ